MMSREKTRRKKKSLLRFVTPCSAGLEDLVRDEIISFGGTSVDAKRGTVSWEGDLEAGYRCCLWSRYGSRVLLELARFPAPDPDVLYRNIDMISWDEHFGPENTLAVFCTLRESRLTHSQYAALKVKDAVVDQFRVRTGKRPNIDPVSPQIRLHLHVDQTEASISLDLSGESLHRRGYRLAGGPAPLKESLAAGLASLAGWGKDTAPDTVLLDPMCGSGTILIEAAMLYGDIAPGLQRKTFGFYHWRKHDPRLWERLVNEAVEREEAGLDKPWPDIIGSDGDSRMIEMARKNIAAAGLEEKISVSTMAIAALEPLADKGLLLVNPPYGERLSEKEIVKYLYRCLGRTIKQTFPGWQVGLFTSNPDLADMMQVQWNKRHRLFNGPIQCGLFLGVTEAEQPRPLFQWNLQDDDSPALTSDFANRLRKNFATLSRWAHQEGISCYRLYDADMPESNMAIDIYEKWFHVQEYAPPKTIAPHKAQKRFEEALETIRSLFHLRRNQLFIKTRQKQKGQNQYQKQGDSARLYEVREQGRFYLVNFTDYLDTGLFLDHRPTRARIEELAHDKRFLNLFGYTGTATVAAAKGGAVNTTTVDVSEKYLERTNANLALNGFGGRAHRTIAEDCLSWLEQCKESFDLIFVDPPTFSNNRHLKLTFDIQKDHERLLRLCMKALAPNGLLIFSTNFKKFDLSQTLEAAFEVREISEQTIPEDFRKNKKIHRCWEFRHGFRENAAG